MSAIKMMVMRMNVIRSNSSPTGTVVYKTLDQLECQEGLTSDVYDKKKTFKDQNLQNFAL